MSDTIVDLLIGLGIDAADYHDEIEAIESDMQDLDQHVNKLASTYSNTLVPAVQGAMIASGVAVAGFIVSSVNAAGDFEAGMLKFGSVTGEAVTDAGLSLDQFKGKFLQLGAETSFSAGQAQDAAIELAKGGVAVQDIMNGATQATLDLASAGELELAPAAGIVAKQLGVWGDTGVTAAQIANDLAQAANASTVDVDELAHGLLNVSGQAHTAGVDFDDLVTTMALIAPQFASSSEAGVSLKNLLTRLIPTTKDATDTMQHLGLITKSGANVFFDAKGKFVGFGDAANALSTAMKGLTEKQKLEYLQTIFGNDAMTAAAALASAAGDGVTDMAEAMVNAGTAAEQAAKKNKGMNFAIDSLVGSFETLQIIVGGAIIPLITDFVNVALIPAVNAVSGFANMLITAEDPIFEITNALYAFSPVLGDLAGYFLSIVSDGQGAATFFNDLPVPIQLLIEAVQGLITIIGDNLTPILVGLATAAGVLVVSAIAGMIGSLLTIAAPILAIVAVVAVLYEAWTTNFLGIQTIVTTTLDAIAGIIGSVVSTIVAFWQTNGATLLADAKMTWQSIYGSISTIINAVSGVVQEVLGVIAKFWHDHGTDIMTFVGETWTTIQGIIATALQIITTIVGPLLLGLNYLIHTHGAEIQLFLSGVWAGIKMIIEVVLGLISGILKTVLKLINGDWAGAWAEVQKTAVTIWASIEKGIGEVIGRLWVKLQKLGVDIVNGIVEGIESAPGAIADALGGLVTGALDHVENLLLIKSPSRVFAERIGRWIPPGIAMGITESGKSVNDALSDIMHGALDSATATITDMRMPTELLGAVLPNGLASGVHVGNPNLINAIADTFNAAHGATSSGIHALDAVGTSMARSIPDGIASGIADATPGVVHALETMFDKMNSVTKKNFDAAGMLSKIGAQLSGGSNSGGLGSIPGFASGGITSGGLIQAGEQGFELASFGGNAGLLNSGYYNMPAGVDIMPHDESVKALGLAQDRMRDVQNTTSYKIDAHYTQFQSEESLIDDMRTQSLLNMPTSI